MPTFTGTNLSEVITLTTVSPTVVTSGASLPGNGRDTIFGFSGDDTIASGGGDDVISGGIGSDMAFMGSGNDIFRWSPGDGSDTVEGGADMDLLDFSGSNISENIGISANGTHVRFSRDVANIAMDLHGIETILFHAFGGADNVTVNDLTGTGVKNIGINLEGVLGGSTGDLQLDTVNVNGLDTADRIAVSSTGGAVVVGGLDWTTRIRNADASDKLQVLANAGKDTIQVASAVVSELALRVDGGLGSDTLDLVPGTAGGDIAVVNNAGVAGLVLGSGMIELGSIEHLSLHSGNTAEAFSVANLTGSPVKRIDIELAGRSGAGGNDIVSVAGSDNADTITLTDSKALLSAKGLPAGVFLHHADAQDEFIVGGGFGADTIDASGVTGKTAQLVLNGGNDGDVLIGSKNADVISGNDGNDVALMGAGDDKFFWAPGDDNDTLEGQGGIDLLGFSGANVSENIDISANGGRVRFFRNVANVDLDLNGIERIVFRAFGGADNISVGNLSGTDVTSVAINLAAALGSVGGDGQADQISIAGTQKADDVKIVATPTAHVIDGLPWRIVLASQETSDAISISTGAGQDSIDASNTSLGYNFRIDGGFGNDTLTGGLANDVFVFSSALNEQSNVDTVRKFSVSNDTMALDDNVFIGIGAPGALDAGAFHIGSAATDAAQRIVYDDASGKLFFDSDGSGSAEQVQFAKLAPGLSLTSSDFFII